MPVETDRYDATDSIVGLARTLRAAGVDAGPERVHAMVQALDRLDPSRRDDVYWAGRLTMCGSVDDTERYDRVFAAYFGDRPRTLIRRTARRLGAAVVATGERHDGPRLRPGPCRSLSARPKVKPRESFLRLAPSVTLSGLRSRRYARR